MSSIGTGIAAGVANAAQTAKQVASSRNRERNQRAVDARQIRDRFEIHLEVIEEDANQETPEQLRIDDALHNEQGLPPEEHQQANGESEAKPEEADPMAMPAQQQTGHAALARKQVGATPLYRHLDIKA